MDLKQRSKQQPHTLTTNLAALGNDSHNLNNKVLTSLYTNNQHHCVEISPNAVVAAGLLANSNGTLKLTSNGKSATIKETGVISSVSGNLTKEESEVGAAHKAQTAANIAELESLISRLKGVLFVGKNNTDRASFDTNDSRNIDMSSSISTGNGRYGSILPDEKHPESTGNEPITPVSLEDSSLARTGSCGSANALQTVNTDELRTILAEIEAHLAVLKDIEDRHATVCEEYNREIRSREETIVSKSEQLSLMNKEVIGLQGRLYTLQLQNRHLEYEVTYLKENIPGSLPNTERCSTPVTEPSQFDTKDFSDLHPFGSTSTLIIDEINNGGENTPTPSIEVIQPPEAFRTPEEVGKQTSDYVASPLGYDNLLLEDEQDKEINEMLEKLAQDREALSTSLAEGIEDKLEKIKRMQHKQPPQSISSADCSESKPLPVANRPIATGDYQKMYFDLLAEFQAVDRRSMKESGKSIEEKTGTNVEELENEQPEAANSYKTEHFPNLAQQVNDGRQYQSENNRVKTKIEKESRDLEEEFESEPLLSTETSPPDFIASLACGGKLEDDVVATSMKAYEHFVKMQHDLETLMKKDDKWRARVQALESELAEVNLEKEDQDYKLSEVTYELDILKHNYNLEIESFGTAVNERETLIEKLQEKMESLKKRYITLDEKFQEVIEKQVSYSASIEEYEGRVKYEQLQREAAINVRVAELEQRLRDMETDYQLEIKNLHTDISCKISIEKELRKRIEELENTDGSGASGSTDEDASVVYYKAQVEALFKEIEREKQEHQVMAERLEDELRLRDKQLEAVKEQSRKDKDGYQRERGESDQKFRKLIAKSKVKEREILALQEKLQLLNDKFAKHRCYLGASSSIKPGHLEPISEASNEMQSGGAADEGVFGPKSDEQLMTELALIEAKMLDMKGKLDDAEEKCGMLGEELLKEREKRRDIETHYLGSLNCRYVGSNNLRGSYFGFGSNGSLPGAGSDRDRRISYLSDEWLEPSMSIAATGGSSGGGGGHHRNSTASLSLLMDENNEKEPREVPLSTMVGRYVQRQRNIFMFGTSKEKAVRVVALVYILFVHYALIKNFL